MAQNYDNGINYIKNNEVSASEYVMSAGTHGVNSNSEVQTLDDLLGYKYARDDKAAVAAKTAKDNFDEFIKEREARNKQEGIDEESREREERENAKDIARNLTAEEIKQLSMMGIDVAGASLSDVMGMVNTLRGNEHREETARLLAKVSAASGDISGLNIVGGSVKLAGSNVELDNINVSDIVATEISNETEEREDFKVSNDELIYLMKNNLPVTKQNLYMAHYSGSKVCIEGMPDAVFNSIMPQIEKAISRAGYEISEETVSGARLLVNNNLPVSPDTIKTYMDYQDNIGIDISKADIPENDEQAVRLKAQELYDTVNEINPEAVYHMAMENEGLTLAEAAMYSKNFDSMNEKDKPSVAYDRIRYIEQWSNVNTDGHTDNDGLNGEVVSEADSDLAEAKPIQFDEREFAAVKAMRQMEQIRLSMTLDAARRLVKTDFNIDTRELSKVVKELENIEREMIESKLINESVDVTQENVSLYKEITGRIEGLGNLPAATIGLAAFASDDGRGFTVNGLYEAAPAAMNGSSSNFETVRRSYEAVGTAPRYDMGDSIQKAFANVDDILNELGIEVTSESQRAVRILGYNSIEINTGNILQIMEYDQQVNELMDSFYPEAVLSLIKDGINPLDVQISELNKIIRDRNYNAGVTEADNFAAYLVDMEKQGKVSAEERESYIGIYRIMNKLAKSGDREAGYLFANGSRLTVRNLISAMRSKKAKGLDVSIDDDFGMLEELTVKGKKIDEQISSAFTMKDDEAGTDNYNEEIAEDIENRLRAMTDETEQFMINNNIEISLVNASAVESMLNSPDGLYGLVSKILSRFKFSTNAKETAVDEETGNMSASLSGEEIPYDFSVDGILESLRGSDEMSLKYDDLREQLTEMMYEFGIANNLSELDLASIKTVQAGFNIMSKMALNDKYQVPVSTSDGVKVMNLTIRHDSGNRGSIEISVRGERMGMVKADLKLRADGRVTGYIVADTSDGNYSLIESRELFNRKLAAVGIDASDINMGELNEIKINDNSSADVTENATDYAQSIYKTSVSFVRAIAEII